VFFCELDEFLVRHTGTSYDNGFWLVPQHHKVAHERSIYEVNASPGAEKWVSEFLAVRYMRHCLGSQVRSTPAWPWAREFRTWRSAVNV
jgi:hypothetical protein